MTGDGRTPWLPAGLAAHGFDVGSVQALSYLVVEEIVDDVASLTVTAWPAADRHGRLRFDLGHVAEFAVGLDHLRAHLYQGWLGRAPRIGDVFGAEVDHEQLAATHGRLQTLERLVPGPVYDLSAQARTVAKLAFFAAVAPLFSGDEVRRYRMDEQAEHETDIPVRPRVGPPGREQGS